MPYFRGFREHCPFFLRSFSYVPKVFFILSWPILMAHPSGWSNHAQAKQQTMQCSNANVVHAAAWQVQLAERD
jgi:hypothetical protein